MKDTWSNFNFEAFWKQSAYATKNYVCKKATKTTITKVQKELGYTLPENYITFMEFQNGGIPKKQSVTTQNKNINNELEISGLFGIGDEKNYSLMGDMGGQFMMAEWEYPDIGVYFADSPSAGHEMFCLDYRHCGKDGVPCVVHVDQESNYLITQLAPNFETFIKSLKAIEESDSDTSGTVSSLVWNPKAIEYEMDRFPYSPIMPNRQLRITLTLHPEPGSSEGNLSRINIPESWESAELAMIGNDFTVTTSTAIFRVNPQNFRTLFNAMIFAEDPSDAEIEAIWIKHAG